MSGIVMLKLPSYTLLQVIAFSLWIFYVVGIFFAVPSCFMNVIVYFFTHFVGLCCCGMLCNAGWHFDTDCQPALCNIPEVWRPQPHCGRSLKSPNGNRKQIVSHGWLLLSSSSIVIFHITCFSAVLWVISGVQVSLSPFSFTVLLKPCRLCGMYEVLLLH